ncbi:MAG TPA: DUF2889 domain-containing protein [Azospirillaceae bacterium]|nr:DUF2889 domain-containing protein [Azospirillaceae bacterium]
MPLSPPAERQHLHTRRVTCQGFRRADGMWDIEGHITDEKTYTFRNAWRGELQPGEFLHQMWIRLTVDNSFTVRAVEAVTDNSPFQGCPAITPNFQRLVGLRIVSGWTQAVRERLGGIEGCTHLVELLGPVATTAFQTIGPVLSREMEAKRKAAEAEGRDPGPRMRPPVLDTCHIWDSRGETVREVFPDFHRGPAEAERKG